MPPECLAELNNDNNIMTYNIIIILDTCFLCDEFITPSSGYLYYYFSYYDRKPDDYKE